VELHVGRKMAPDLIHKDERHGSTTSEALFRTLVRNPNGYMVEILRILDCWDDGAVLLPGSLFLSGSLFPTAISLYVVQTQSA